MELKRIDCLCCLFLCLSLSPVAKCQTSESNTSPAAETSPSTSSEPTMSSTEPTEPTVTSSAEPVSSEATTEPQTTVTSSPTSPTTPPAKQNHYEAKDGEIVCMVMDATFVFKIPYLNKEGQMATRSFPVPDDATSDGQCRSNQTELLDISFFEEPRRWKLHIDIEKTPNNEENDMFMADENVNYSWEEVTLTYFMDAEHFPDAEKVSDDPITMTTNNQTHLFAASSQGSYKCAASQNVEMDNVTLEVSEFRYRAFGTTTKDTYPDSGLQECSADKKDDDDDDTGKIVGIVVGSVVGGLILLIIIGCLIQRARKRGSYEKV